MLGHLNHATMLNFLERARWALLEPQIDIRDWAKQPVFSVVRHVDIGYLAQSLPGEDLVIRSGLLAIKRTSYIIKQDVRKGRERHARRRGVDRVRGDQSAGAAGAGARRLARHAAAVAGAGVIALVDDTEIAFDDIGSGLPVVFLHAFPLNRTMWEPQIGALVAECRCIPIDLRGFGDSAASPPYSMDRYADDVAAVLDTLQIERAVIVGLSMGGYVAFALWRRHRASRSRARARRHARGGRHGRAASSGAAS